jgi:phage protein D
VPGITYTLLLGFAPAPPELLDAVEEIEVDSSLEEASVFRLKLGIAATESGDWSVLEDDPFRPLAPVSIKLQTDTGLPETLLNGYVSSLDAAYGEGPGESSLEVSGMDATLLMNLQEKVMPWPSLPDAGIATAIFGQYGLVPQVQPTPPVLVDPEGTTIQRGTDIRFLRRLARRNGFDCYVQPEPLTGLDFGHFEPRSLVGAPQAVLNVKMGVDTNVSGFRVRYDATKPTTAVAAGLDIPTKAPQPALAPAALQVPLGAEPALTRVLPPPIVMPADTGLPRTAELQAYAQAITDRSSFALVAEGETAAGVSILRPGGLVNVRGVGALFGGSYLVTRVRHRISSDGWTQRFEAVRNAVRLTGAEVFVELPF